MSVAKKITAFLTSLAVVFSVTGCGTGKDTAWSARYNDYETTAGIFIFYEMNAYYEATQKAKELNAELDTSDVKALKSVQLDGKDMLTWIQDEATESLRKYLAVQSEFDKRGLMISIEDNDAIQEAVESSWEYYGDYYEVNGIGKESFEMITALSYKSAELFESYYGTDGTDAVPIDDVKKYYDENYARTEYLSISLKDADGNAYDDDTKAELKELAEEYVERINDGEDFSDIRTEYTAYITELQTELAEKKAEEEAEKAEEEADSEGNLVEENVEVTEAEAPNDEEVEEISTAAEEETKTAEETTASEGENSDDKETEKEDDFANEQIIKKGSEEDSFNPSEIVNNAIFEQKNYNEAFFIDDTDNSIYYVAVRYDITERDDLYEDDSLMSILNEMKGEDYDEELLSIVTIDSLVINDKAYNRYNPFDFTI